MLLSKYKPLLIGEQIHSIGQELYDALVNKDLATFAQVLGQIQTLNQIKDQYQEFYELLHKLKVTMPLFGNQLTNKVGLLEPIPGSFSEIIDYAKLTTLLRFS